VPNICGKRGGKKKRRILKTGREKRKGVQQQMLRQRKRRELASKAANLWEPGESGCGKRKGRGANRSPSSGGLGEKLGEELALKRRGEGEAS